MSLTKEDLVDSIRNQLDLPKGRSVEVIESLMEIMKKTLGSGEDVLISRFGKFCVKEKRERRGRNPQTGEDLILRARRGVIFQSSHGLKAKINGEKPELIVPRNKNRKKGKSPKSKRKGGGRNR